MSFYIVCQKKRNNPRMDIRICEKKCDLKYECKEFISYHKSERKNINIQMPVDIKGVQLGLS